MKAGFKILVLSAGLLFSCGVPVNCEDANASGNSAMTPVQCAAAMKNLQQQSASLSQQLRSCKTNAVCAPIGVRLNRITQQLLSLKRKCSPALPAGASSSAAKKTASALSSAGGIDLKDASGEVLDLKASWEDIPEFGSADSLSASMDTAILPQRAQAAGDGLPICPRNGAVFCPGNLPCPEKQKCVSDIPFPEEGWLNDCMANVCGQTDGGGGGCPAGQVSSGWWIFKKCVPACGGKPYNTAKKCCVNGTPVAKCGSACWNPVVECCQDGKIYPGKTSYLGKCMTLCEAILGRIGRINTYIAKWKADPNYTIEGDPNTSAVITYAETFCWKLKGPEIKLYEAFYNLDPELQKAITVHENVHALQCKPYTLLGMTYYWKDKELLKKGFPGPFEIPAHEAEREILKSAADKLHCQ